jgi:coenzyme F420-0:L-glutamate ligase / coenzyme F420-1:gamma-L-glutamate ligase
VRAGGSPRLVPIAFAIEGDGAVIYSALDEKPKSVADVRALARVRDILARPQVSLLVDRWSEEWNSLGWVRLDGDARLLEPTDPDAAAEHAHAVSLLRARYPQYANQRLETLPVIRIVISNVAEWSAA